MRSVGVGIAALVLLIARPAHAQPADNNFAIDLFQGPILAPIRVTSMAGAYAGYAEGIAGFVSNAASPAIRHSHSSAWWDMDLDASFSVPIPLFGNNDFDNSGDLDADYTNFIYLSGGLQLQAGPFGAGFFGDLQRYTLTFANGESNIVLVGRYHLLVAWQFFGGQFALGGGARATTLGLSAPEAEITFAGIAPQFGALIKPDWTPFRLGATYRHRVNAGTSIGEGTGEDTNGVLRAGQLIMPNRVELPYEVELGIAIQVGARPLNPSWIDPNDHERELRVSYREREITRRRKRRRSLQAIDDPRARQALREKWLVEEQEENDRAARRMKRDFGRLRDERRARAKNWPREHLLLTADLLITGPVDGAIHLERFLAQQQPSEASTCAAVASGESVNFSPRIGFEMEPVSQWVHTRFGSYYEPNRYRYTPSECSDRIGRQHFTFGADVKLATTTWFGLVPEVTYKLQVYGDLAPRYQSFGAGFGVWY